MLYFSLFLLPLLCGLLFLALGTSSRAGSRLLRLRNPGLALIAIMTPLTLADGALRLLEPGEALQLLSPKDTRYLDPDFGTRPKPGQELSVKAVVRKTGETLYDVIYSIDEDGFRKSCSENAGQGQVLFFGGSFTFGEGVADDETYSCVALRHAGQGYSAINTAFSGYGPHHMLRLIELNLYSTALSEDLKAAFYLMIPDHLQRAAGLYSWNLGSPRYTRDAEGKPIYKGLYLESPIDLMIARLYEGKGLLRRIAVALAMASRSEEEQLSLTLSLIRESDRLLHQRHARRLTVLLWDSAPIMHEVAARLRSEDIGFISLTESIENLDQPGHVIAPGLDNHPNSLLHEKLGQEVAATLKAGR